MRYTNKPVTVEAVRFIGLTGLGDPLFDVADGMPDWLMDAMSGPEGSEGSMWTAPVQAFIGEGEPPKELFIGTIEGQHIASAGDWIIQGIKGELYPCKPDIFEGSYISAGGLPVGDSGPEVATEFVDAAKATERSMLLDMQPECIQLRVALSKARDWFQHEHPGMAEYCQKAIDCRPATGSEDCSKLEALDTSGRQAVAAAMDRAGEVPDPVFATREPRSYVIGEGFKTVGDSDGFNGA